MSAARMPLLDGLRGIAAIGVVLYHAHYIFGIAPVCGHGYLFVDLFFTLSGFVLTRAAGPRLHDTSAARRFLAARFRRFWPMVALGTALGMVQQSVEGVGFAAIVPCAVAALAMMPLVSAPNAIFPLNGPQWSLMMELLANAVHAFVLRRLSSRALVAVIAASGLVLAPLILAQRWSNLGPFAWNWYMAPPRVLFSYGMGVWMARQPERTLPAMPWWLPLALVPAVVLAVSLVVPDAWGDLVATLVLLPAAFWLATRARPPLAAHRWLEALGRLSFPLYATQIPILILTRLWLGPQPMAFPLGLATTLGTAHLIGRALERQAAPPRPTLLATA